MTPASRSRILFGCLAINLIVQLGIKYVDVHAAWAREPHPSVTTQSSYDGLWERGPNLRDRIVQPLLQRCYNVVFWIQVSVMLACWRFGRAALDPRLPTDTGGSYPGSWWVSPLLMLAYVLTVALEPGTFFARRPVSLSRAMQVVEGIVNLGVICVAWESARIGARLAQVAQAGTMVSAKTRCLIVDGASAPFWGLATYCVIYPLVIAERLHNDEVMAMLGTLVCYVAPHLWVIRRCRRAWRPQYRVEFVLRSPFGPHVIPYDEGNRPPGEAD